MDSYELNRIKHFAFFDKICPSYDAPKEPIRDNRTPIQKAVDKYISEGDQHTKLFVNDLDSMLKDMGY